MGRAWFTEYEHISTDFENLTIVCPKITCASFVEKVVTAGTPAQAAVAATDPTIAFNEITEGIFGRKVYIIVDTEDMQGDDVTIELVRHDDGTNAVKSVTNGTADVASFTATVGDTTPLEDINGNNPYGNLTDFEDKAIFKIDIRPHARADFDTWAQEINTATSPSLKVRVKPDDAQLIVEYNDTGVDNSHTHPDGFIFGQYEVENKNVYEIYHKDNVFNNNPNFNDYGNTQRRRPISKLTNNSTNTLGYIYKDLNDNEHEVCESEIFEVSEKFTNTGSTPLTTPNSYIQAQQAFEDVLTDLNPHPNPPASNPNRKIPIFTDDFQQVNDALVQNRLTETPDDLFQMLTDYRNIINGGVTDAQIDAQITAQIAAQNLQAPNQNIPQAPQNPINIPQTVETLFNHSNDVQRQNMIIIQGVIDQTIYALEGVDARFTCQYPRGIFTSGDTGGNYTRKYYENTNVTTPVNIKLINALFETEITPTSKFHVQHALNYTSGNLSISFYYNASRRRYVNPDLFAGFIGALAQLNYAHSTAHVVSTGFSFPDASCYPSVSHINGKACDTLYFNQLQNINPNLPNNQMGTYQQPFINALYEYGFNTHLSAFNFTHITPNASHDDHLHSYRFNRYVNQNNRNFIENLL